MTEVAELPERGVIVVEGPDRASFLQGLVTNDLRLAGPERALFAAFLTPQGKFLHDFFLFEDGGRLLLDCEAGRRDDLLRRLRMYRLRAQVTLADGTGEWAVAAVFGDGAAARLGLPEKAGLARPWAGGMAAVDPRLPALGVRIVAPRAALGQALAGLGLPSVPPDAYDSHRLGLGVPEGSRDLVPEKAILLESGYDDLHAIAWDKGCYLGQELTARTKYRGLVKKRLVPVALDGIVPPPGTPVTAGGREVGELRSGRGGRAIALLRLEALALPDLEAAGIRLRPDIPAWLPLQAAEA